MRKHNGMRPQDIPILLKIVARDREAWLSRELATELFISQSEVSDSLNRSVIAGLLNAEKRKVHRQSLMEFIEYGLPYVFPVVPGGLVNGMYTATSHPFMQEHFQTEVHYVWPDSRGKVRGLMVEPLYIKVTAASEIDEAFYKMMALIDVIRIGKPREINVAVKELKKLITP